MRKVIVSEFVTLDGVMEDPSWTFQFSSEEQERFKFDEPTPSGCSRAASAGTLSGSSPRTPSSGRR
jgi:hypothetical protein